jgi:hypothetical protein
MTDLNSKKSKPGDFVDFRVKDDVKVDGSCVIRAGSSAVGHVVAVGRKGFLGRSGKLGLSVDYTMAVDGSRIRLRGQPTVAGGDNRAVTAAATATWGPAALLMRGWDAELNKGTAMNAYVDGDQSVNPRGSSDSAAKPD